jgi:hypothetical protein
MYLSSRSIFKVALFWFSVGIRAKASEKNTDHGDSLELLNPGPATVHMFTEHNQYNNSILQKKTWFETNRCYNMVPLFIKAFTFIALPVCKNGTVAKNIAFQRSNCLGYE